MAESPAVFKLVLPALTDLAKAAEQLDKAVRIACATTEEFKESVESHGSLRAQTGWMAGLRKQGINV